MTIIGNTEISSMMSFDGNRLKFNLIYHIHKWNMSENIEYMHKNE